MRLSEVVKNELQKRWLQQHLHLPSSIIPEDAHFTHVLPFIPRPDLNQQNVIEILKKDNDFYKPGITTEAEVVIFAKLLFYLIQNNFSSFAMVHFERRYDCSYGGIFHFDGSLRADFYNSRNLADILGGNFSLELAPPRNPIICFIFWSFAFCLMLCATGWTFVSAAQNRNVDSELKFGFMIAAGIVESFASAMLGYPAAVVSLKTCDYYSEYNRSLVKFYEKYANAVSAPTIVTPTEEVNLASPFLSPSPAL